MAPPGHRALKDSLREDELVVHVDFAENFNCKLNREVQAFHFGGNRKQATVHSCVAYTSDGVQSYATISGSLRHDERAVWAHLEPVVKDVLGSRNPRPTTLHVMSDGPVTQYRNKKNFYLMSTIPFLLGFKQVTWNFSEKSHGKGAPDGVGGAVKRIADTSVNMGADIQTPDEFYRFLKRQESSKIKFFWVCEEDIRKYDESVPEVVPLVKGTLGIHQILSIEPGAILHRELSCFCSRPDICQCYKPTRISFQRSCAEASVNAQQDLTGKFVLVRYEEQPFVGQVLQVVDEELEVS